MNSLGPRAYARFPAQHAAILIFVKSIRDKVTGNAALPNLDPTAAVYGQAVTDLDAATSKAEKGSDADVADRAAKELIVFRLVHRIVNSVQTEADTMANAADAVALITGAGLQVKKVAPRKKPALAAKYTGFTGQVLLVALAILDAGAYYWEFSLDQRQWSAAPETKRPRTTITGLTAGQVYFFRFRALTSQGKGDYSPIVSLLAH